MTFKWPLKIGKIYGNKIEHGHIIVGLTQKISSNLPNLDLAELKWVVFDECDKIKDDSTDLFKQILLLFSQKKVKANVLIKSNSVPNHLCNRKQSIIPLIHPRKSNNPQCCRTRLKIIEHGFKGSYSLLLKFIRPR